MDQVGTRNCMMPGSSSLSLLASNLQPTRQVAFIQSCLSPAPLAASATVYSRPHGPRLSEVQSRGPPHIQDTPRWSHPSMGTGWRAGRPAALFGFSQSAHGYRGRMIHTGSRIACALPLSGAGAFRSAGIFQSVATMTAFGSFGLQPSRPVSDNRNGRARRITIWHFTDG